MQIIILTSASSSSGGTRQALYLVKGLMENGHEVIFFTPPDATLRTRGYDAPWADLPQKTAQWRAAIEAHMKKNTPCIVQAFHNKAVKAIALAGLIWRLQKRPVVCFGYRGVIYSPRNPLPYLSPGMAGFIANSQASARTIRRISFGTTPVHVVYNAIPEQRLCPGLPSEVIKQRHNIAANDFVIGTLTGDAEIKGVHILLPAFAKALHDHLIPPTSVLMLLGATAEKWMPLCRELNIEHAVRIIAHTDSVADYLQCMNLYTLASLSESLPNALIEAMCMGLPAIGTTVGGVPELLSPLPDTVAHKNTQLPENLTLQLPTGVKKTDGGILVPPGNPDAFATALGLLSQSPELRHMMAQNNLSRRNEFDLHRRAKLVESLYYDALAKRGILHLTGNTHA